MNASTSKSSLPMEEIIPTINLVVYLIAGTSPHVKKHPHFLGGHGYTYSTEEEGKKKLVKDVPTSSGYFAGNVQKANTVVTVRDIVSLTIANKDTKLEALLSGYLEILNVFAIDPTMKNLCLIAPHKEFEQISKFKLDTVQKAEEVKLGGVVMSPVERSLLEDILNRLIWMGETKRRVIIDLPGSAEGGLGNREVFKQLDLAEVITQWGFEKEVNLQRVSRKEYENPELEFNKLVCATRWYFETNDPQLFYNTLRDYRVYSFGKVEPDKSYYGKLTPDVTYSRLYTLKPLELLDKLFEFTKTKIDNPDGYLSAGDLNNVVTKDVARLINQVPGVPENKTRLVSPFTKQNGKPLLVELIAPVLMSYRIREHLTGLDIIFEAFMERNEENVHGYSTFYDITDEIYVKETNGKGVEKLKLNPAFTQLTEAIKVKVNHPNSKKSVPIMLSVGYDLPDRNSFNTVEDPGVRVWVVTDTRNKEGIRYSTLVQTEDYVYIHTAAVSNLRVLTLSELGRTPT